MLVESPAAQEVNTDSLANQGLFYSFKAAILCRLSAIRPRFDARQT